ncbi:DUF6417 family protein [Streptomyces sp. NPDC127038]|uniref:DUF6417 family protein n=1 Tax=Streptomyces sp. NPDC127038 TaxID=3347114 RepID=UPI003651C138
MRCLRQGLHPHRIGLEAHHHRRREDRPVLGDRRLQQLTKARGARAAGRTLAASTQTLHAECGQSRPVSRTQSGAVGLGAENYDHLDLDDVDFAPLDDVAERLTPQEAHELLQLLLTIAQDGHQLSLQADRLAMGIAARILSEG